MNNGQLILTPKNPQVQIHHWSVVIDSLKNIGLIKQPYIESEASWFVGDQFMQWIGFMGCSPFILLEPEADKPFCFIRLMPPTKLAQLKVGSDSKPPRCPDCKKPIKTWKKDLVDQRIYCEPCDQWHSVDDFRWRRYAGLGCAFIEISNIFQGEATPVDALFQHLKSITGEEWLHFYLQTND